MRQWKLSVAAVAAAAGLAVPVLAQSNWASAVDGNWNDPTKWDNGNVPDNGGETGTLGFNIAYTVKWNQTLTAGGITITNTKANLDVVPGVYLLAAGDIMNNGTIRINPDKSATNAHLRFDASAALAGSGSLILFANQDDLDDSQLLTNGSTITQGSNHTIRGSGSIRAPLTNNGTVDQLTDYQMSAWAMAVVLRDMTDREMADLTLAMVESGTRIDLSDVAVREAWIARSRDGWPEAGRLL